jgi:hypothetical protein
MSQQNLSTTPASFKAPADLFATLTVGGTTANLSGVLVGEKVTAAGGGTAKVSGIDTVNNKLRLKGIKGATSTWSGALTFGTSAAAAMTASAFSYSKEVSRYDAADVTKKIMTEYSYTLTDRGFELNPTTRTSSRQTAPKQVVSAVRGGLSKSQSTDTTAAPTLSYTLPAAKTYQNGQILTFVIKSNEALSVAGAPRIAIVTLGSAETVYATLNDQKSDSMNLYFDYALDTATTTAGQIVSVAYNANGAVVTDIGGTTVTPSANLGAASVTGIILA